jgi:amidase
MMLGAGAGREATLLELAYELEEAAPWASIRGSDERGSSGVEAIS